jgi:mono/diheme cytochrome c family protein
MLRKLAMLTAFCVVPALAAAQTPTIKKVPAPNTSSTNGPEMFQAYCSACHGKTGKGDGPAAAALKNKPADLTMIAKNHGGTFSTKDFEERIAGTSMSAAHGTSDMPVWGPIFRDLPGNDKLRIYNLKQYIDSIQVK